MTATKDNTKFLYTYFGTNVEKATAQFRRSGFWADVPVFCAALDSQNEGADSVLSTDFLANRIRPTLHMCKLLKAKGIQYIFMLDCVDTLFIKKQEEIFEAFNRRYKNKTILITALFSKPALSGHVHCDVLDSFAYHWTNRRGYRCVMISNSAGHIDTMIEVLEKAIEYSAKPVHEALRACPECYKRTTDDLVLFYRIHKDYPALFDCDSEQEVFSYYWCRENPATMTVAKLRDDNKHPDNTVGTAGIIHGSGHFHHNQSLAYLWKTLPGKANMMAIALSSNNVAIIEQNDKLFSAVGYGRIIDISEDQTTCRVRLCDSNGMPIDNALTDVKYIADLANKQRPVADLSDDELNTIARQNMCYNSHFPVVIE